MQKVDHRMCREQTRWEKGQIRVLTIETICVRIECEVVEVKELKPVAFGDRRVAASPIENVRSPDDENDIESLRVVSVEKLAHYRFHAY